MEKKVKVFVTVVDGPEGCSPGPAGDGTFVHRFRTRRAADDFVAGKTYYGRPAKVHEEEVSQRLARRWGFA